MKKKLKVVWLCIFSNEEKRNHLRLWRRGRGEYGQWIPNLLRGFEAYDDLDLHVVSTDSLMTCPIQSWTERNITYHCFQEGMPILGRHWPLVRVDDLTGYWQNRRRIGRIVSQVKPDLIHLFGVENPHYGSAALDLLEHYPVLVTIQGFIHRHRQDRDSDTPSKRVRCRYEEALLRRCHWFSGDYESETVVRQFNAGAAYRHFYFPVNEVLLSATPLVTEKPYDILFAGNRSLMKGFDDFLHIVRDLAKVKPDLVAAVVGHLDDYPPAVEMIMRNGLASNIRWLGRFPTQEGLFNVYRQSKLFLAPTYNDCFPSTIRECMMLGTPVIAYATGGIPWANRDGGRNIAIVTQGDRQGMTDVACRLLGDPSARNAMADRAQIFAQQEFSMKANAGQIRRAYQEIAADH
jgi:glycosyltransferase involved in cell wall biosynthesis